MDNKVYYMPIAVEFQQDDWEEKGHTSGLPDKKTLSWKETPPGFYYDVFHRGLYFFNGQRKQLLTKPKPPNGSF